MKHAKQNLVAKQLTVVAVIFMVCVILAVMFTVNTIKLYKLNNKPAEVINKVETMVVEKEVVVEVEKKPNYTYDELYCMAVVIYNEAGGNNCTDEQRELVGYVVLNRVNDTRYPNTIREVLEQPGQYQGLGRSGVNFAKRSSDPKEVESLERAWLTAKKILENRNNIPIPSNVIFQAAFKQGIGLYKQIGNTYFCYAKEVK